MAESTFLGKFRSETGIHSADFMAIWLKYDADKNGYIEKKELDDFLKDLMKDKKMSGSVQEFKNIILEKFDVNYDGRLDLKEMAKLCPVEENFITKLSSDGYFSRANFNKIFQHYDRDNNGSIDGEELPGLFRDLLEGSGSELITTKKLEDYTATFMELFDKNKDGKFQKEELLMVLPIEDNFLSKFVSLEKLTVANFNEVFQHYDRDNSGAINGDEIGDFFTDLVGAQSNDFDAQLVEEVTALMKKQFDKNKDGKFQKDELMAVLDLGSKVSEILVSKESISTETNLKQMKSRYGPGIGMDLSEVSMKLLTTDQSEQSREYAQQMGCSNMDFNSSMVQP